MTRYYRIAMAAALLSGLALPALAQTLPPAAPTTVGQPDMAAPGAAPADEMAPATKTAPTRQQTHHHVSHKHKTAVVKTAPKPTTTTK